MITADYRSSELLRMAFAFVALGLWTLLVHDAIYSASVIWIGNEIFNHCALVIPASIYLIWERRKHINWQQARSSYLALLFLFGQLILFLLGSAGDIQLFQHIAVFAMLPTLFWFFVGDKIAWQLQFPLVFVLFAVPVGEELVPFLQEITADISVYMLQLSGIPLFRSGLFIEIPQGKFLVAEACSGVSFLIASIVIGNLYAYMNLRTASRRIWFVVLSVIVPILANAVRVYGIILVGYWSDMEHAVGADHLIYGWFFFAFVIIMLLLIGEWIRARETRALKSAENALNHKASATPKPDDEKQVSSSFTLPVRNFSIATLTTLCTLLLLSLYQQYRMSNLSASETPYPSLTLSAVKLAGSSNPLEWQPLFKRASDEVKQTYRLEDEEFDVYYAYFDGSDGELVSSLHRLYQQDRWTLVNRDRVTIDGDTMLVDNITSSVGVKRSVYYFYIVDGQWMISRQRAKLQQIAATLQGVQSQGAIIAVSFVETQDQDKSHDAVLEFVHSTVSSIYLN